MRNFAVALMVGLLAFTGPTLAADLAVEAPGSPPPPPPPPSALPCVQPDGQVDGPCILLLGAVVGVSVFVIAEGTREHTRAAPASP
jgi:hypothetical protein